MNIAVLSGRKSQHGDSDLTPFLYPKFNADREEKKLSALVKRGCWVFVIGKKLIDTALQLISGFTEFVNQGGKSEPIKKNGKN